VDAGNPATPLFPGSTRTDGFPDVGIIDMGYHYPSPYNIAMLDIKVMLQGPFAGTGMQTYLNNFHYLPLVQPFQGAPWNYNGAEAVAAIPNNTIVDWVLLELRQAPDASQALPGTILWRQAAFVTNTGEITGLDGNPGQPLILTMPQVLDPGNSLFIIIWHRNHLGVLSAEPMQQSGTLYSYDFSTGADKAFGGVNGHIEVGQGIWGMVSGDGNADGQVNNADKVDVWLPQGGFSGYRSGDFNLDGQVNNQDKVDRWLPNGGRSCQVGFTMQGSFPTLSTLSVTSITDTTAMGGGNITDQGSFPVCDRGVCWSITTNPDIYDFHTHSGCGTGSFTCQLTGLTSSTYYYVKAFAANNLGYTYGNQVSFFTLPYLPIVITQPITNITDSTATGGGEVTVQGISPVTARGVCWSTSENPTLNDPHTLDGSGLGVFTSQIIELSPVTVYYVRAYATNQEGTSYGGQVSFTTSCPGIPAVIYQGKTYNTVQIGTQCWMEPNLDVGTMITGTGNQTNNGIIEKYCYNNSMANCDVYGGLYQWKEMMQYSTQQGSQGICPSGWHIPTDDEWTTLTTYLGGKDFPGGKMKEAGYAHWAPPNTGATNESGFTALPGGGRYDNGSFLGLTYDAIFWSSTETISNTAWMRYLSYGSALVTRATNSKYWGHSVRCLQD
jgi:uncharacterized protein (TIGR02145 family)